MGWSIGFDTRWNRDVGYGVPAQCDHPDCNKDIDRGLGYVCGGDPYGGEHGCGLFFCGEHQVYAEHAGKFLCERCAQQQDPFEAKPDTREWINWKLTHDSWQQWRDENPNTVSQLQQQLHAMPLPDFDDFQARFSEWAFATFKGQTVEGKLNHLIKEVRDEIIPDPDDIDEWGDAFGLFCNAALLQGFTLSQILAAIERKWQTELVHREWLPPDADGCCHHVKKDDLA